VIPSTRGSKADKVKRIVVCSGKVYYDLAPRSAREGRRHVAILRVEQLYPFPHKAFEAELKKYPNATEVVWCQDEPQNQGAWFFIQHYIHENMREDQKLYYAGRPRPLRRPCEAARDNSRSNHAISRFVSLCTSCKGIAASVRPQRSSSLPTSRR
jgi:2-oxoglutarate dehydrogenase complex dehydrogenase (E1) component-like enzyme